MLKKILIIIIPFLFMFIGPYLWVEVNTYLYKDDFETCYQQVTEIFEYSLFKVYCKNQRKAKIVYLTNNGTFLCEFNKDLNQEWKLTNKEILWSRYGNASEFFYPFYRIKDWNKNLNTGDVSMSSVEE